LESNATSSRGYDVLAKHIVYAALVTSGFNWMIGRPFSCHAINSIYPRGFSGTQECPLNLPRVESHRFFNGLKDAIMTPFLAD